MVKRSRGFLSKATRKMKTRKKISVNALLKPFEIGESIRIVIKPYYNSLVHRRYNARTGQIIKKQGQAYVVKIKDGKSEKMLIIHPLHLEKMNLAKK